MWRRVAAGRWLCRRSTLPNPRGPEAADHGAFFNPRSRTMTLNKLRKLLGGAISVAGAVVLVAQHL
jgi:hypothetical protein